MLSNAQLTVRKEAREDVHLHYSMDREGPPCIEYNPQTLLEDVADAGNGRALDTIRKLLGQFRGAQSVLSMRHP